MTNIKPEAINKVGVIFFGQHWSSDIADATDFSKSWMTRLNDGSRQPNPEFLHALERLAAQKITDILSIYRHLPLPSGETTATKKALAKLKNAAAEYAAAVKDWKPDVPFPSRGRRSAKLAAQKG